MKLRTVLLAGVAVAIVLAAVLYVRRRSDATEEWEPGKLDSAILLKIDESAPLAQDALHSLNEHRWDGAVRILRRAAEENPQSAAAHYNLGIVLLPFQHEEGRDELEEALRLNKNYPLAIEPLRVADKIKLK